MDGEGEEYYCACRDTRNTRFSFNCMKKPMSMCGKSYSYKAQRKIFYAKEKREMQREAQRQNIISEQNLVNEKNEENQSKMMKNARRKERQKIPESKKIRQTKHAKDQAFLNQKKGAFYKMVKVSA